MKGRMFFAVFLGVLAAAVYAGEDVPKAGGEPREMSALSVLTLREVMVPRQLLEAGIDEKFTRAMFSKSSVYVEAQRNGKLFWRSPAQPVQETGTQERFLYDVTKEENSVAFFKAPSDKFDFTVYMAESEAIARATEAAMGGLAGALVGAGTGAGIGAIVGGSAGAAGGPPGAATGAAAGWAVGAIWGGISGAVVGATAGFIPVENARVVATFSVGPGQELFATQTSEPQPEGNALLRDLSATLTLQGGVRHDQCKQYGLDLQKPYVIRVKSLRLSSANEDVVEDGKYYLELSQTGLKESLRFDLGNIPCDTDWPLEILVVARNRGGEGQIKIYRDKWWRDPVVFEAKQGRTDGRSWLFIGDVTDDFGSTVSFETFSADRAKEEE